MSLLTGLPNFSIIHAERVNVECLPNLLYCRRPAAGNARGLSPSSNKAFPIIRNCYDRKSEFVGATGSENHVLTRWRNEKREN